MRYMALIYGDTSAAATMTEAERGAEMAAYDSFTKMIVAKGILDSGEALQLPTAATTVRVKDGRTLTTDGPFAETKEQLIGYYVLKAKDLDEAVDVAAQIPGAKSGSIELRPIVEWN